MFPQLEDAIGSDIPFSDQVTYFSCLSALQGANADKKQIKFIREKILELIENVQTRNSGLLLFEAALQQETPFYVTKWPEIILANLDDTAVGKELACRIVRLILRPSIYESHNATADYHAPKIILLLINKFSHKNVSVIQCLTACYNIAPGATASTKLAFEPFIIKQMDSNSRIYSEAVSECFVSYLSATAVCNKKTLSYQFYYRKILNTLQLIINKLYDINNDDFFVEHDQEPEVFDLPELPQKKLATIMRLARVYETFALSACKLLCRASKDRKPFETDELWILEFINRVLECSQIRMSSSSEHDELLKLVYPIIHRGTFQILQSLIHKFGLRHQVENIFILLRKSIELSEVYTHSDISYSAQSRFTSWKTLGIWLDKYGGQISHSVRDQKYLIAELLKDTIPHRVEKDSTIPAQKHLKSKSEEATFMSLKEERSYNIIRTNTCFEALKILKGIIFYTSPLIEEEFNNNVANSLLNTLKTVRSLFTKKKKFPFPYTNTSCRKALHELLLGIIMSSNFPLSVTSQSLAAFKKGESDASLEIREVVRQACLACKLKLIPNQKFPEALKTRVQFEPGPSVEETVVDEWEMNRAANVNHSDRGNHSGRIPDSRIEHSSEDHSNMEVDIRPNSYVIEKEYCVSDYDQQYVKGEIQCNGEDVMEDRASSPSDSESEEEEWEERVLDSTTAEEENASESACKPFITSVHSTAANEITIVDDDDEEFEDGNMSAEDGNMSAEEDEDEEEEEEEGEFIQEEKIETKSLSTEKAVVRSDQNGVASVSEDEVISFSKGENSECSMLDGSYEEESAKEFSEEQANEEADDMEAAPPSRKQRLSEESEEVESEPPAKKLRLSVEGQQIQTELNNSHISDGVEEIIEPSPTKELHLSDGVAEVESSPTEEPQISDGIEEIIETDSSLKDSSLKLEECKVTEQQDILTNSKTEEHSETTSVEKAKEREEEQLLRWSHRQVVEDEHEEESNSRSPPLTLEQMCDDLQLVESAKLAADS